MASIIQKFTILAAIVYKLIVFVAISYIVVLANRFNVRGVVSISIVIVGLKFMKIAIMMEGKLDVHIKSFMDIENFVIINLLVEMSFSHFNRTLEV